MSVLPNLKSLHKLRSNSGSAGRQVDTIQATQTAGVANDTMRTKSVAPRRKSRRAIEPAEAACPVPDRRTKVVTKPKTGMSGAPFIADQPPPGIHSECVSKRRSVSRSKTKGSSNGATSSVGHSKSETQGALADSEAAGCSSQTSNVTQPQPLSGDHCIDAIHLPPVTNGSDRRACENQTSRVAADSIPIIIELWRRRQSWHRAEKSLTLQASAICRRYCGGDKKEAAKLLATIESGDTTSPAAMACAPLLAARAQIEPMRELTEKQLVKLVKPHPVATWIKETYGVSLQSCAAIIGEAGDVGSYKSVAALWKRMGLAVIKGERQRRVGGIDALEHGYAPHRRSVMWNIGNGLIGCMGKGPRPMLGEDVSAKEELSPYQRIFIERLRYEAERDPEHKREPVDKDGVLYESFSAHAANRAKRYVEKRFLRDLYAAWKRLTTHAADTAHPPLAAPNSSLPSVRER